MKAKVNIISTMSEASTVSIFSLCSFFFPADLAVISTRDGLLTNALHTAGLMGLTQQTHWEHPVLMTQTQVNSHAVTDLIYNMSKLSKESRMCFTTHSFINATECRTTRRQKACAVDWARSLQ